MELLGERPYLIAGPCSAESREQLIDTARELTIHTSMSVFRAGVWKPRTHPDSFEGVGDIGLKWLCDVRQIYGVPVATEVATAVHVEKALTAGIDILWIGTRTTANPFAMQEIAEALKGCKDQTVLIKNPINPDLELWHGAYERLYLAGVHNIAFVHRGFSLYKQGRYRNAPYWQIPLEMRQRLPEIPLICDPSHIAGRKELISEISQQALSLGFEGLMIESHIDPASAKSDKEQQITPKELSDMLLQLSERISGNNNIVSDLPEQIKKLRVEIDELDDSLLRTLASRMQIATQIGDIKKEYRLKILQTDRWEEHLAHLLDLADELNLDRDFIVRLFLLIHHASIEKQF